MSLRLNSKAKHSKPWLKHKGFTLVELLVVVMLVALLSSAVVLGVNAITGRQLQSQGDQLMSWLQWAQQASMLSGSSYGIAEHEGQLLVVAPLNGKWYQVVGLEQWRLADGLRLQLPESGVEDRANYSQVDIIEDDDGPQFLPFMVFSNVGLIDPVAEIKITSDVDALVIEWSTGELAFAEAGR